MSNFQEIIRTQELPYKAEWRFSQILIFLIYITLVPVMIKP